MLKEHQGRRLGVANTKEYNHQYYLEHKEKFKDKAARWTEDNREKMRECNREYYRKNKEKVLAHKKLKRESV